MDISSFKRLKISPSRVENVYHISHPCFFGFKEAMRERERLVEEISAMFPVRAFWLSDAITDGDPKWLVVGEEQEFSQLFEGLDLHIGEWLLFFFAERKVLPDVHSMSGPMNAAEAVKICQDAGDSALIVSYSDDIEWTLYWPR